MRKLQFAVYFSYRFLVVGVGRLLKLMRAEDRRGEKTFVFANRVIFQSLPGMIRRAKDAWQETLIWQASLPGEAS